MSLSDDDDDLPLPKKQRIYYGSLEEKLKDIASGGGGKRSANDDEDNLNGDEDSDNFSNDSENEDNDAIAQAVRAGNINISEGESIVNELRVRVIYLNII